MTMQSIFIQINTYLFVFGMCFAQFQAQAQDIRQLEKKRAFKDLKIGEEFSKYKDRFEFVRQAETGHNIYKAIDDTIKIGHLPIEELNLLVYNKKIYEIRLKLDIGTFEQVKEILFQAYGEPNDKPCEELELEELGKRIDCFWKGESMFLWCSAIDFKDFKKAMIGFKDLKMAERMKKELTKKAVGDL